MIQVQIIGTCICNAFQYLNFLRKLTSMKIQDTCKVNSLVLEETSEHTQISTILIFICTSFILLMITWNTYNPARNFKFKLKYKVYFLSTGRKPVEGSSPVCECLRCSHCDRERSHTCTSHKRGCPSNSGKSHWKWSYMIG